MKNRKHTNGGDVVILSDMNCIFGIKEYTDPERQYAFDVIHYKIHKKALKIFSKNPRVSGGLYKNYNTVFFSVNVE